MSSSVESKPAVAASDAADRNPSLTKKVSSIGEEKPSQTRAVLAQARRDLWQAHPIFLTRIFNPLRDFVFDPALAISCVLLPPLLGPTTDAAVSKCIHLMTLPIKYAYSHLPHDEPSDRSLRSVSRSVVLHPGTAAAGRMPKFQPPSDIRSAFTGGIAFAVSAVGDIVGVLTNPAKMKKWVDALGQLKAYLDASGVGDELEEAMMKPMLRGRLLDNLKILNDIQEKVDADRAQKAKCCEVSEIKDEIEDGHKYMRFATAAYGTEMIKSALDREVGIDELRDHKCAIAAHCEGIEEEDIRYMYCKDDGDHHVLHHFCAVDRQSKNIVLALRGTLSLSGAIVDVQGMAKDFCLGLAHQGMADMADAVWAASGEEIRKLFTEPELEDFGLIITGHSLGAGTASLLNVKCHVEKLVGDRPIKCYAFAPPPTFNPCKDREPNSDAVDLAMQNCVAYIHDNDAVPFLSISSVRRLASLLDAVDNNTEHMWFWKRWRIFHEWDDIPQYIYDAVADADKPGTGDVDATREVDGACEMIIPARVVVWMKNDSLTGGKKKFSAVGCDAAAVASGTVFMSADMFSDHLPEQYEDALDALLEDFESHI